MFFIDITPSYSTSLYSVSSLTLIPVPTLAHNPNSKRPIPVFLECGRKLKHTEETYANTGEYTNFMLTTESICRKSWITKKQTCYDTVRTAYKSILLLAQMAQWVCCILIPRVYFKEKYQLKECNQPYWELAHGVYANSKFLKDCRTTRKLGTLKWYILQYIVSGHRFLDHKNITVVQLQAPKV